MQADRLHKPTLFLVFALLVAMVFLAVSCTPRAGWGLVIWAAPGDILKSGDIIPVYVKTSIGKVYIAGTPDGKSRLEIEWWRVELFRTRRAARLRAEKLGDLMDTYMRATRDGVPVREKASNSNDVRRLYRLREGQSVKVFEKVEGEPVLTGGKPLPGDWYRVMTDDGTQGYVFSYAMKLYRGNLDEPGDSGQEQVLQARLDSLFSNTWRPAWFRDMIDSGAIDPDRISPLYGLFADGQAKQVRIELPGNSSAFSYTGISERNDEILFEGSPLRISFIDPDRILVTWSGSQEFIIMPDDVRQLVRTEELARQDRVAAFIGTLASALGESATSRTVTVISPEAGKLQAGVNGRFSWTGRISVPEGFFPEGAGETGQVSSRLTPDISLAGEWDGTVSFFFGTAGWVDCLWRISAGELILVRADIMPDTVLTSAADVATGTLVFPLNSRL